MPSDQCDWQQQLEEVVALQSIFGDEFSLVSSWLEPACGPQDQISVEELSLLVPPKDPEHASLQLEILIFPDVSDLEAVAGPQSSAASHSTDDELDEKSSPHSLTLGIKMRSGYPSNSPPEITIEAPWLRPDQIIDLVHQLLALWNEQGTGMPICFAWADWLKSSAVQFVQEADANTGAEGTAGANNETAIDTTSFNQGTWQCGICFDDIPGSSCIRLEGCTHFYCIMCLQQDWHFKVASGEIHRLKCPTPDCRKPIPVDTLKDYMIQEDFTRWQVLALEHALGSIEKMVDCPTCSKPVMDGDDHCAKCTSCLYVFCSLCHKPWHENRCTDALGWASEMARRSGGAGGEQSILQQVTQDLVNQMLSMREVKRSCRQCPNCHMAIERTGGCNKMVCSYCDSYFCYRCGKAISGYEHFDGDCELFPEDGGIAPPPALARALLQQRMPALGYFLAQAAADRRDPRIRRCPKCGQANAKEGQHNVLRCWSCACRMCYSCGDALQGKGTVAQHFTTQQQAGRKKICRQHSPD